MSFLNSVWLLYFVIFCIGIIFLGYKYFTRHFDYWKKRGVYTSKPVPFFGSLYDVATFKLPLYELVKKLHDETDEPYFGMFLFDKPILVVKSPKLVKDILIKDFNTFDRDLLVSNAIFLLIAGTETSASIISFALYELALHPGIQGKLRNEIKDNYEMYKGFTYEGVLKNKYLDMVIHETMRKYAVLPFMDREAITDYRLEGTDLVIEKGMIVYIPLFAIMRDSKYFPNPEQFDPDRFADNNYNSDGLVYFPFGEGPKACIGKRLGLLAVASCLSHILLNFNIEKCENTPDPVEFEKKSFALQSKCGLPITFSRLP
ncbi:cytochrome P450 6j1-like [Diabrotica virgifera virgifera]|uniref:Cytochrome P450 6k1-like n=1 Tax=Diabrotica virgifera virgifera TaxID=50390 RepID=A0ABM5KXP4_DIAVI|nr:cytochrome P450 6j1-like [Diabrotica virgifera virgifera]